MFARLLPVTRAVASKPTQRFANGKLASKQGEDLNQATNRARKQTWQAKPKKEFVARGRLPDRPNPGRRRASEVCLFGRIPRVLGATLGVIGVLDLSTVGR